MMNLDERAREIADNIMFGTVGEARETVRPLILEALTQVRRETVEEAIKIVESLKLLGEYEDCPSAWLNCAFKRFEEVLRSRIQEGGK